MFSGRSWQEWIDEYAKSHLHPVNRACHFVGIPVVAISILLIIVGTVVNVLLPWGFSLFAIGWVFQFLGHWFEKKPPEFLKDWRFLFVGLRWWCQKVSAMLRN